MTTQTLNSKLECHGTIPQTLSPLVMAVSESLAPLNIKGAPAVSI